MIPKQDILRISEYLSTLIELCSLHSRSGFSPVVPDTAPTEVGGGGGTKSELVITWEVSHLSDFTAPSAGLG